MADLEKIVDRLSTLTVIQATELSKMLEEKWGVSAVAPVAAAPAATASAATGATAEKTNFDIVLISSGDKKIEVIKAVREVTGLGLKEAKELVDGVPKLIKNGANKAESEDIKAKLEAAGAKVEVK